MNEQYVMYNNVFTSTFGRHRQSKNIVDRIINRKLKYEIYLHIRQNERLQVGHLKW